jgi:hypothetical protein
MSLSGLKRRSSVRAASQADATGGSGRGWRSNAFSTAHHIRPRRERDRIGLGAGGGEHCGECRLGEQLVGLAQHAGSVSSSTARRAKPSASSRMNAASVARSPIAVWPLAAVPAPAPMDIPGRP